MEYDASVSALEREETGSAPARPPPALVPAGPARVQTCDGILFLQRHAGNSAVGRMLDARREQRMPQPSAADVSADCSRGARQLDYSTVATTGLTRTAVPGRHVPVMAGGTEADRGGSAATVSRAADGNRREAVGSRAGTRLLQRQHSGQPEGAPGNRPNLDVGDSGPGVGLLQRLLGAPQTGVFDEATRKAVDRFQRQQGWEPSGVGPETWRAIDSHAGEPGRRPNLVEGDRGPGVRLLQRILGVQETGVFDQATRKAVDAFQRAQGWEPSGVGPETWKALDNIPRNNMGDNEGTQSKTGEIMAGALPLGVGTFTPEASGPASGVFRIVARGAVTVANDVIPEATAVVATPAAEAPALGLVASTGVVIVGALAVAGAIYFAVKLTSEAKELDEYGGTSPPGGAPKTRRQYLEELETAPQPETEKNRRSCAPRLPHNPLADVATCTILLDDAPARLLASGRAPTPEAARAKAARGSVSAVLSIVDKGCLIGRATGVHDEGDLLHAEEACMAKLAGVAAPPGSILFATVSSPPCVDRHNCHGQLIQFAAGKLLVYRPEPPGNTLLVLMGHRAKQHLEFVP